MNIADQMHHKKLEIKKLLKELRGINPKLSTYQSIKADIKKLEDELATLGGKKNYVSA